MSLELVNTFGTLLTVAIVAATAIAAMVQLRHLRAGNQINAMLSISSQFDNQAFLDAGDLVREKAASAIGDPEYRAYALAVALHQQTTAPREDDVQIRRAILLVANTYEELGILVKNGIVDKDLFLDRYCWVIAQRWRVLEEHIAFFRAVTGDDAIWENFEFLTVLSQDYLRQRPSRYPAGMRRIKPVNAWPLPPVPATA